MAGNDNKKIVRDYITHMPSLPITVSKVLEVCNNPRTSPIDLDNVIKLDPVLMGRVLKLINSAYYGLGTQVTSLARARAGGPDADRGVDDLRAFLASLSPTFESPGLAEARTLAQG